VEYCAKSELHSRSGLGMLKGTLPMSSTSKYDFRRLRRSDRASFVILPFGMRASSGSQNSLSGFSSPV
jgi:hypothetical protein